MSRDELRQERARLVARLAEIDAALSGPEPSTTADVPPSTQHGSVFRVSHESMLDHVLANQLPANVAGCRAFYPDSDLVFALIQHLKKTFSVRCVERLALLRKDVVGEPLMKRARDDDCGTCGHDGGSQEGAGLVGAHVVVGPWRVLFASDTWIHNSAEAMYTDTFFAVLPAAAASESPEAMQQLKLPKTRDEFRSFTTAIAAQASYYRLQQDDGGLKTAESGRGDVALNHKNLIGLLSESQALPSRAALLTAAALPSTGSFSEGDVAFNELRSALGVFCCAMSEDEYMAFSDGSGMHTPALSEVLGLLGMEV